MFIIRCENVNTFDLYVIVKQVNSPDFYESFHDKKKHIIALLILDQCSRDHVEITARNRFLDSLRVCRRKTSKVGSSYRELSGLRNGLCWHRFLQGTFSSFQHIHLFHIFLQICGNLNCCYTPWLTGNFDEGNYDYFEGSSQLGECSGFRLANETQPDSFSRP